MIWVVYSRRASCGLVSRRSSWNGLRTLWFRNRRSQVANAAVVAPFHGAGQGFSSRTTPFPSRSGFDDSEQACEKISNHILKAKLGTLSSADWDDTFQVMYHWFCIEEEGGGVNGEDVHDGGNKGVENVNGFSVDAVNRLVQRLLYEHATKSAEALRRRDELYPWLLAVIQGWLQFGEDAPWALVAPSRATTIWMFLADLRDHTVDDFPVQELAGILYSWLKLQTPDGAKQAIGLLLSEQIPDIPVDESGLIVPYFRGAVEQSEQFFGRESTTTALLLDRMTTLTNDHGWETFRPSLAEVLRNPLVPFKPCQLMEEVLATVKNAAADELSLVNDIIERFGTPDDGQEASQELESALFEYFLRNKDHRQSLHWFQKLDATVKGDIIEALGDGGLDKLKELIQLWGESGDKDAPWRADEILARLLCLSSQQKLPVKAEIYGCVASLWIASPDPIASKKATNILSQAPADASLFKILLDARIEESNTSAEDAVHLLKLFRQLFSEIDDCDLPILTEKLARLLAAEKTSSAAMGGFIDFLLAKKVVPTTSLCELSIGALSPPGIIRLFDVLCENQVPPSFDLYKSAITSLGAKPLNRGTGQIMSQLFAQLFAAVADGTLQVEGPQLGELICCVQKFPRPSSCDQVYHDILKSAENLLINPSDKETISLVPLDFFKFVMRLSSLKGRVDDVQGIFDRVVSYYKAGYSNIVPDSELYSWYIASLRKDGHKQVDKKLALLYDLIDLYERTGMPQCKPTDGILNKILNDLSPTGDHADRAFSLVSKMVSFDVEFNNNPSPFDRVMYLELVAWKSSSFQRITDVLSLLDKAGVDPSSRLLRRVMMACREHAKMGDREGKTLAVALETLTKLRNMDSAKELDYVILFEFLGHRRPHTGKMESIIQVAFDSCCADGQLGNRVCSVVKRVVSPRTWNRIYEARLLGGRAPEEWSRRANG